MRKIERLKLRANEACALRGHRMGEWKRLKPTTAESVCDDCNMGVVINTHPAPNDIDIGGKAVALTCDEGPIKTVKDVFDFFGADYDADLRFAENNRRLSRRVSKDTECGAWAAVHVSDAVAAVVEDWTARYARIDGVWTLHGFSTGGVAIEMSDVPTAVHSYFWDGSDDFQSFLFEKADSRSDFTLSDTVSFMRAIGGVAIALTMGSIVEGIDSTVDNTLTLPTTKRKLEAFVEGIEDEATGLWNSTHGCDACGPEALGGYREINPECNECGGLGTII
jgi:hypothetical protein